VQAAPSRFDEATELVTVPGTEGMRATGS
jgi:hypothetical protein